MSTEERDEPIPCEEARRLLARFVGGELSRGEDRPFRAHVLSCTGCRDAYRESIQAAARLGRQHRAERERTPAEIVRGVPERPERHRGDGRDGGDEGSESRERTRRARGAIARYSRANRATWFRLRLVLVPAVMIVLFSQLGVLRRPSSVEALALASGVVAAGADLAEGSSVELSAGGVCASGSGRARLATKRGSASLEPRTLVVVEDPGRLRLRLERGTLALEGELVVTTPFGIATCDGAGRLTLAGGSLEASCEAGSLTLVDAAGERTLAAGESARLP